MFVAFSFNVDVDGRIAEGPFMGGGDVDLLKKLFPKNPIWKCNKSKAGNQMNPTVAEMKSLYLAMLNYSTGHKISSKLFPAGNYTGSGPVLVSSASSLFQDLIKFCEEELGFKKPKKLQVALARKEKQEAQERIAKAKRIRKSAFVVTTKHSIYDIGCADEFGRRNIIRRGRPLSDATTGLIVFVRKGKHMRFFLDGNPNEYESSTVQSIKPA